MMLVGNVHLVAGGSEMISKVAIALKEIGIDVEGNPDVYMRAYKSFGIDEARELRERSILRPLGERRVFVVAAPDMNREAQNALLKAIEEPPGNALFFFIVPNPETLLPTFRSRAHVFRLEPSAPAESVVDTKKFLAAIPQKRLEMLKVLLEKGEDDLPRQSSGNVGKRDLSAIVGFLSSLEEKLAKTGEGLEAVYRARKFVTDKGALVKPLLEQVALLVPTL